MPSFLPDARFVKDVGGSGQLAASDINDLSNEPSTLSVTVAARGALVPLLYGRRNIPGLVFALGKAGTDLLVGYLWCLGEVDAIEAIYINDAVVPGGVTLTNYLGTPTQAVDPTLQANIAGYNDRLRVEIPGGGYVGMCYTVARIPVSAGLTGFPQARATIRGRKIYDERTATTAYSDNTALCVADLISNPTFGLGRTVLGTTACANWCDSLLGGIGGAYRSRLSLYIAEPRRAEEYVDLMCEYAECFRINEGDSIRLTPNMPVDLDTVETIGPSKILKDSLSLRAESSTDTPTEMEISYTKIPTVVTQPWALEPVTIQLPGVSAGEVQRIPTSVSLEGVYREIEASNKAQARLMRMQNRISATWTTLDKSVSAQRGDVVMLEHPSRGVSMPVRITSVNMVSPGRYQVSADRYDISHYPSEVVLPGEDGIVPVGVIGLLVGTTVPAGWEIYSAANGKFVVGAGGTYSVGANGNSTSGPFTGSTDNSNGHSESPEDIPAPLSGVTSGSAFYNPSSRFGYVSGHAHTFSVASVNENILRRENILVKKVGTTALKIPPQVRVFGMPNMITEASKNTTFAGRLLMPAAANTNAGVGTQTSSSATTGTANDWHYHYTSQEYKHNQFVPAPNIAAKFTYPSGGAHDHSVSVTPTYSPKRQQVCLYEAAVEVSPRPGQIWLWDGSPGSLPAGYILCDGSSGTVDMRDRYVEFTGTTPSAPAGNNTVSLSGTSSEVGHSHQGDDMLMASKDRYYGHGATVYHSHTVSTSYAYLLKYYALHFIMYAPS